MIDYEPKRLLPLKEINDHAFYRQYFAEYAATRQDSLADLSTVVDAAVMVAVETMWPTLLKFARQLKDHPVEHDGWVLKSAETSDRWSSTFLIEEADTGAGYVFNLQVWDELTDEAKRRVEELSAAAYAAIMAIEDDDERERRFEEYMFRKISAKSAEEQAILAAQASFRNPDDCHRLRQLICVAYKNGEAYPEGQDPKDSFPKELSETLSGGFGNYNSGEIFKFRPSIRMPGEVDAEFQAGKCISDICAPITVLNMLSDVLMSLDLDEEIQTRGKTMDGTRYLSYSDDLNVVLTSLGVGSVHNNRGIVGERTMGTLIHFHNQAACADMSRRAETLAELVDYIRDGGHISPDNQYDCNDMDDFAHVVDRGNDGTTLYLATQHNQYRIDLVQAENGSAPKEITLTVVPDDDFNAKAPQPGEAGFLAFFVLDDEDAETPSYSAYDMGPFETAHVRALNDLFFSIESMHCCWEEDHADEASPTA